MSVLDRPCPALAHSPRLARFGPNWFGVVMGTGVIANAAALVPRAFPGRAAVAAVAWLLAAGLLTGLAVAGTLHIRRHGALARGHHRSLTMAPFYGTVSMAVLTVGSGALLAGRPLLGTSGALIVACVLWTLGTLLAMLCATLIPYLMFTLHRPRLRDVQAGWLLPVVPPVVAATGGAGIIAHLGEGGPRRALELFCAALVGFTMPAAAMVIVALLARLARRGPGAPRTVPSLWLVLGPLGSSITAVSLLAHDAGGTVSARVALIYGLALLGLALVWLSVVTAITIAAARRHLPFSLGWWAFTFPVGVLGTGTSELARQTHAAALGSLALALFALLLVNWLAVASLTGLTAWREFPRRSASKDARRRYSEARPGRGKCRGWGWGLRSTGTGES